MKNPIIRLSIAQTITLSGTALDNDGKPVQINQRFQSEENAHQTIDSMRDEQGFEFQLIVQRAYYDKRAA